MRVRDAAPGQIIETILFGVPSGNLYKIGGHTDFGMTIGYRQCSRDMVLLHSGNFCRVVDAREIGGFKS